MKRCYTACMVRLWWSVDVKVLCCLCGYVMEVNRCESVIRPVWLGYGSW